MENKYYKRSEQLEEKRRLASEQKKVCSKCRVLKDFSEFTKDLNHWTGKSYWCKECKNASIRKHRESNPELFYESMRYSQAKIRYGIEKEDYLQLLESQNHLCAICSESLDMGRQTHIDHCHDTGRIRGILCGSCNKGIGMLRDSPTILRSAADYLDNF